MVGQCDQFLRYLNIPIGSYMEGNPSGPCRCEPVPLSLALTDHPFLVFTRQMNVQISWTMVVHELSTINLILSSTETMRCLNNIRQLQQPLFQSINHVLNHSRLSVKFGVTRDGSYLYI